jgi:UTP--glucose-1-phosphate uridylyltransferase
MTGLGARRSADRGLVAAATLAKSAEGGATPMELVALRRRLDQLAHPSAGQLPGAELAPVEDLPRLSELPEPSSATVRKVLNTLVVLKLNGGLGTSMGLSGPKSLVEVKHGHSFLDIIARQVLSLQERHGVRMPLVLMNSATTRRPSLEVLRRHPQLRAQEERVPLDFLQGREPKLRADDLYPVTWPSDPDLEWCPPGHGDLYLALAATGTLDRLLEAGLRWCFVSNADNLGAVPDPRMAAWVADQGVPFLMEVVRGTPSDRKGGHLARHNGRLVLRETAQVPDGDATFTDIERWRYYNTNNLWVDLRALQQLQASEPGAPVLPLIVNTKRVDPVDPSSTPVVQLETAMGAAVGSIEGARALHVPRERFAPVKTTDDLLVVTSDAYELTDDGRMVQTLAGPAPVVTLDKDHFGMLADFKSRFAAGPPSLRRCTRLEVEGDVTFGAGVVIEGAVRISGPRHVADGEVLHG